MELPKRLDGAVIAFDLDGTLVETAPDLIGALNVVLGERRLPALPFASARALVGGGARVLIERGFAAAGEPLDEAEAQGLVVRFIEVYRGRIASESRPFPGVEAALDQLAAAGAVLAVCTNKPTDLSNQLLEALGLARRFRAVIGADRAPRRKPDPSHLLHAIAEAGGDPARALMIGDSRADAEAARAAHVPCVLVTFGYTDVPVETLGADLVIEAFADLPAAAARLLQPRLARA
jgi:phosphoglycolate phosphatase